jgi:hypothetical protein
VRRAFVAFRIVHEAEADGDQFFDGPQPCALVDGGDGARAQPARRPEDPSPVTFRR